MNRNHPPWNDMPIGDFISLPDTIPLTVRNGSLTTEYFRQEYHIRAGTALSGDYHIDYVNRGEIENIIANEGENILSMIPIVTGLLDVQSLNASGIIQVQRQPYLDLRGSGTLIGFVDTGIDYTKPDFRYEDGTSKIKYIWDQTINSNGKNTSGSVPDEFHFGTEFSEEQINAALHSDNPRKTVPHLDNVGHGTFLASVAAGRENGEYIGAAPDAEIIAVKLKQAGSFFYERFLIPNQQENAYTSGDLMLGIQYIINKAQQLRRPVAICIAVGSNTGGHNGLSLLEEYLTRVSNITGVAIICAAGNESRSGHHTDGRVTAAGQSQHIELSVKNHLEDIYLTLVNGASDRLAVSVTSPAGEVIPRIPVRSGTTYSTNLIMEKSRVMIEYYLPLRGSGDQCTIIRILHPTPGIWRITVHGEIVLDGTYHCWLPITGFIDSGTMFMTPSPNYTTVIPSAATGVIVCGAYDSRNNSLYTESSWGPTRQPMLSPDFAAPGVNVSGTYPTGRGQMSGTSVSAAITAGACALMLQWGIIEGNELSITSSRIRANLIRGCTRSNAIEYPNVQWGYGTLNLFNTFNSIRPI